MNFDVFPNQGTSLQNNEVVKKIVMSQQAMVFVYFLLILRFQTIYPATKYLVIGIQQGGVIGVDFRVKFKQ